MNRDRARIHIIGIGDDGLNGVTQVSRNLIQEADLIVGSKHTLALITEVEGQKLLVGTDMDSTITTIQQTSSERIVVLASGDPLFYGVARYLCNSIGKDQFEVIPHVSSMQLAFARVKESWDEAFLTNLSNRSITENLEKIRIAEKVGLFTNEQYPPSIVARELLNRNIDYFSCYVCENLGSPDERVTHASLTDITNMDFSPLNVMILIRIPGTPDRPQDGREFRLFGNPDELFAQSKPKRELLTISEVRAVALAELNLTHNTVLWDIGAGSGSVAIEAAQLIPHGEVYAVEQDPVDFRLLESNVEKFGVTNVHTVHGQAPEVLEQLPRPTSVFLGGVGHEIVRLLEFVHQRAFLNTQFVINLNSVDHLSLAHQTLLRLGCEPLVRMLNIARGTHQLEQIRFDTSRVSFLLTTYKLSPST